MAWNGSGAFARVKNYTADAAGGAPTHFIDAAGVDQEFENFKTVLENCLTRDGQNSPSQDINWGGQKVVNLGDATAGTDALNRQTGDGRGTQRANNLSDLANVATARSNLQLDQAGMRALFQQTAAPNGSLIPRSDHFQ